MTEPEKHTVLIVDDDEQILRLIEGQLAHTPHRVIPTASPAEAIHVLKSCEVSVLLCDLNMPDINGNAVLNTARDCNPNIISIVMSGGTDHSATIRAINEGGVWKFLMKPWACDELLEMVTAGISRYETLCHQQRQLEQLAQHVKEDTQNLNEHMREKINSAGEKEAAGVPETTVRRKQIRINKKGAQVKLKTPEAPPEEAVASDDRKVVRIVKKKTVTINKPVEEEPASPAPPKEDLDRPTSDIIEDERYQLNNSLGQGTFGIVYLAEDRLLDIPVAIKILDAIFTSDDDLTALLRDNTRMAMQLSHKHIVRLHNFQPVDEYFFLVMEYVEGRNLREILQLYHHLPMATVLQILKVCADALSYAHRHNVVHGDLKPTNLMLTNDGVLKIVGFGMAGVATLLHHKGKHIRGRDILYLSPEQAQGQATDHRGDIYSLAVVAHELLTGELPFADSSPTLDTILYGPDEMTGLSPLVAAAIEKAMAFHPDGRWESVERFFDAVMEAANV
ncbi:MAG: response regulator [Spartobacteria bacterium]|nr:response regulator [Spartobacteria bacterium]